MLGPERAFGQCDSPTGSAPQVDPEACAATRTSWPRSSPSVATDDASLQTLARQVGSLQDAMRDVQARSSQVASSVRRAARESEEDRAQLQTRIARLEEAAWLKAASYEPEPSPPNCSAAMEERLRRLEERMASDEKPLGAASPVSAARLDQLESRVEAGLTGLAKALRKAGIEQLELGQLAARISVAEDTERRVTELAEAAKAKAAGDQRQSQMLNAQMRQLDVRLADLEKVTGESCQQSEAITDRVRLLDAAVKGLLEAPAPKTDPNAVRVETKEQFGQPQQKQQQHQLEGVLGAVHQVAADMRQVASRVHYLESAAGRADKASQLSGPSRPQVAAPLSEPHPAMRRSSHHPL